MYSEQELQRLEALALQSARNWLSTDLNYRIHPELVGKRIYLNAEDPYELDGSYVIDVNLTLVGSDDSENLWEHHFVYNIASGTAVVV